MDNLFINKLKEYLKNYPIYPTDVILNNTNAESYDLTTMVSNCNNDEIITPLFNQCLNEARRNFVNNNVQFLDEDLYNYAFTIFYEHNFSIYNVLTDYPALVPLYNDIIKLVMRNVQNNHIDNLYNLKALRSDYLCKKLNMNPETIKSCIGNIDIMQTVLDTPIYNYDPDYKKEQDLINSNVVNEYVDNNMYPCPLCKGPRRLRRMQTRALDEGVTVFADCKVCDRSWKVS